MHSRLVSSSSEEVAWQAAFLTVQYLKEELVSEDLATFVLAGGSLPPAAFNIIAREFSDTLDWSRVLFAIGDERCVPLDDGDSSWLPAIPMLDSLGVPSENRLRPESDLDAEIAAERYARTLEERVPISSSGALSVTVLWLGMGPDGHTLSLFPDHPSSESSEATVIAVRNSPKPPPSRITLTGQALRGSKHALALVTGAGKADVLSKIGTGAAYPITSVAQAVSDGGGSFDWLIDHALHEATLTLAEETA